MKKTVVMGVALALGITASAYAANPFSDVPAGHWAYDSISRLAAAGVVEGYPDGTFGGDKLMTRYEMAQIVAKAMAKGASVDRLAAEFADELDNLGVRVAALEKKTDNVRITGELRYSYGHDKVKSELIDSNDQQRGVSEKITQYRHNLRSRIWLQGRANDDWTYTGMLQNVQDLGDNAGNEETKFQRAYVDGKLGGVKVRAGRQNLFLAGGNLYDTRADGVVLSYGKDVKLTGFYVKPTDQDFVAGVHNYYGPKLASIDYDRAYGINVAGNLGKVKLNAGYTVFHDGTVNYYKPTGEFSSASGEFPDNKIWNVGVELLLGKDFVFTGDYLRSNIKEPYWINPDRDGYVLGLRYGGAKNSEPGSFGVYANYYDQGMFTVIAHTMNGVHNPAGNLGVKGYMVGADYAFAKNLVGAVEYYDLKNKEDFLYKLKSKTIWSQLTFTF